MGLLEATAGVLDKFEAFVGVNLWTMIFAWINLLILYLFLKKLLFRPLKNMIDSRQGEIDEMYSDAEKSVEEAQKLRSEYESRLEAAEEESEEILRSATRRAQLKEEEILRRAANEAERTRARAEEQIALEKKQALNDVKDKVSELAIDIAAAVIERDLSKEEHSELIDEFIDKIGDEK